VWALALMVVAQLGYAWWVGGDAWEAQPFVNRYVAVVVPELAVLAALGVAPWSPAPVEDVSPPPSWCRPDWPSGARPRSHRGESSVFCTRIEDLDRLRPAFVAGLLASTMVAIVAAARLLRSRHEGDRTAPSRHPRRAAALVAVVVVLLVLATAQQAVRSRWTFGAPLASCDTAVAEVGVAERDATAPDAVIAVWWSSARSARRISSSTRAGGIAR
jgi:hypothetical protein